VWFHQPIGLRRAVQKALRAQATPSSSAVVVTKKTTLPTMSAKSIMQIILIIDVQR
jgi:hypothetical protein